MAEPLTLAALVATSKAVRETPARLEKRALLRELFARLDSNDLVLAATFLAGETPQGSLQVGWRALAAAERAIDRPEALPLFASVTDAVGTPARRSPTLSTVNAAFEALRRVSGAGAARRRQGILIQLLAPLSAEERSFIRALVLGELRQGALRAVVLEAIADTFEVDADAVRRAVMFAGAFSEVLSGLKQQGPDVLARFGPRPGVPIEPMLATPADDPESALARFGGRAAAEWKLDGVRLQLHRIGPEVRVFSRQGRDVTELVPEVVALGHTLAVHSVILDGELIGLDAQGRPAAFQDLMSRFTRDKASGATGVPIASAPPADAAVTPADAAMMPTDAAIEARVRLVPVFFDVLERDGASMVERPYNERRTLLLKLLPASQVVPQSIVEDADAVRAAYEGALHAGHEGLVLKGLDSPYTAGRRGAAWCKVKPAVTLDLVILAAEWGHGRRQGWLSNLHLGVRDDHDPERFLHVGKTFKGLTDAMLRDMTAALLELETRREGHVVHVRPVRVVEIAFDTVQRSHRYDSGLALRFARVKRFRPDKSAVEANTHADLRAIHTAQR